MLDFWQKTCVCGKKVVPLRRKRKRKKTMEDYVLSIPKNDYSFVIALAQRMGWLVQKQNEAPCLFSNEEALAFDKQAMSEMSKGIGVPAREAKKMAASWVR